MFTFLIGVTVTLGVIYFVARVRRRCLCALEAIADFENKYFCGFWSTQKRGYSRWRGDDILFFILTHGISIFVFCIVSGFVGLGIQNLLRAYLLGIVK